MVTFAEALKIARDYLDISNNPSLYIMEDLTIEFEYGWVFFYQSTERVKIAGVLVGLGGNAPVLVDKLDGTLHRTGTAYRQEKYIEDYIKKKKMNNSK
ncbi:YrhB domain-containing protein [Chitinophaga rhizophila]|uniref:YrhB family protein n=1 Tax=Chitinophaga rhizophila TaxID=2866212 RepID=A0ABS7GH15_9BACT|nr:YrhB domain-containing protein [Chitinophaga rhizophila]MBW8686979.1 YrhB family protein [Chitinophaga rhizophila]